MAALQLLPSLILFFSGLIAGVLAILVFNKLKTGSASANNLKKEKETYQAEVEAHFEETSEKFKAMAEQYQDLYQHLSVGATTLCRPDKMAPGLQNQSEILKLNTESKPSAKPELEVAKEKSDVDAKQTESDEVPHSVEPGAVSETKSSTTDLDTKKDLSSRKEGKNKNQKIDDKKTVDSIKT